MSSAEACLALFDNSKARIKPEILRGLADRFQAVIEDANRRNASVQEALDADIAELKVDLADAKAAIERNAALNARARDDMQAYLTEHWGDDPGEGLLTMLTGVQIDRPGAKNAVSPLQHQIFDTAIGKMTSRLETPVDGIAPMDHVKPEGFLKGQRNPNEWDVFRIMWHMDQAEPDPSAWSQYPQSMVKAAEILLDAQESMRKQANSVGSHYVAKLDHRIANRTYDAYKMRDVGPDEFIEDMARWIDSEKTKIPEDVLPDVLLRHYNQEVSGERIVNPESKPESNAIPPGMGNLSKAMAERRVFHFKDVEAEIEFREKYGRGFLLESIVFDIELGSQRIGLMTKFGPNAKANFDAVAQRIAYDLTKSKEEGAAKKLQKFQTKLKKAQRIHWPVVDGSMFVAENHILAKNAEMYRSTKIMSQLGSAILPAFADVPIYASQVSYSGGSYAAGIFEAFNSFIGAGKLTPEKKRLLAELGVIADNMRNTAMSRFDADHVIPGGMSRLTEKFFNLNLLTPWTDRGRVGFAMARAHDLALQRSKSYGGLEEGQQRVFRQFEIEEAEWDVIRQGAVKSVDGRQYITPEALDDLPDSVFEDYLNKIDRKVNPANIRRYRRELKNNLKTMFQTMSKKAALEPDAATRAVMLQGTRPGTGVGEGMRTLGMYKGFPLAIVRMILGSELYGYDNRLMGQQGFNVPATMRMARMIIMSTLFGAIAMSAKDVVSGREPRILNSEDQRKTLLAALLQGGAMGLYGDFLFGEYNRYGTSFVGTLVGPAGSDIDKLAEVFTKITQEGEPLEAGQTALRHLFRQVPGSNLFYAKMAYDYMVIHSLMEITDPGSVKRMQQTRERDLGHVYFLPPTSPVQ